MSTMAKDPILFLSEMCLVRDEVLRVRGVQAARAYSSGKSRRRTRTAVAMSCASLAVIRYRLLSLTFATSAWPRRRAIVRDTRALRRRFSSGDVGGLG